ncbi:MAG: PKD domain-containing protein, partial [Thermoplasmatales archaeon]|nr:PKD domain-containing protein [Thermoplasmatales archaeon]
MAIKNQCTTLLVVLIITLMVTGGFGSTLIANSYNASSIKTEKLNNDDEVNILGNANNPIMNTITFNSTSSDGYIYAFGSDYSEVWNNNGNSATIEDTLDFINMGQFSLNDVLIYIYRAYLFFDTSSLPDDAVIASATLSLYGKSGTAWDFYIRIQNGQPTYPHNPINQGDYDRTHYSGNGGQFYTSGWSTSGYNDISLNSNGTSWINKQGTTKLCLRSSKEINGIPPLFNINEVISFYSYEKGNDYRPKLAVEYTIPNNPPNTPSKPSGPESGEVGELLTYSTSATDPDGDQVRYKFDWGDGNQSDWTDWVDSGQSASESYSWNAPGTYHIKAKAQDTPGDESEWSLPLTVTITESSGPPVITGVKTYYADGSEISGGDGLLLQGMDLDNTCTAYVSGYNIEWVQFELGFQEHTDCDGTDGWTATFNSIDIIDPNAVLTITAHNILGEDTKEYHPKIIPMVGWLVNFVDYVTNYNDTEFV